MKPAIFFNLIFQALFFSAALSGCFSQSPAPIEYHHNDSYNRANSLYNVKAIETPELDKNNENYLAQKEGHFSSKSKKGDWNFKTVNKRKLAMKQKIIEKEEPEEVGGKITLYEVSKFIMPTNHGKIIVNYNQVFNKKVSRGVIIKAQTGDSIKAVAGGVVTYADYDPTYQNMIIIEHEGSNLYSIYGFVDKPLVMKGDKVFSGEIIAHVSDNEYKRAAFMFFGVREAGKIINPVKYLPKNY